MLTLRAEVHVICMDALVGDTGSLFYHKYFFFHSTNKMEKKSDIHVSRTSAVFSMWASKYKGPFISKDILFRTNEIIKNNPGQ